MKAEKTEENTDKAESAEDGKNDAGRLGDSGRSPDSGITEPVLVMRDLPADVLMRFF